MPSHSHTPSPPLCIDPSEVSNAGLLGLQSPYWVYPLRQWESNPPVNRRGVMNAVDARGAYGGSPWCEEPNALLQHLECVGVRRMERDAIFEL